jgi:hypothetical protein
MEKTLSQKEVIDLICELDYKKLHAAVNDLLFESKRIIIDNPGHEIHRFEVYTFENFKTQLLPRIEVVLVAVILDSITLEDKSKIIYSSNSFGYIYKTNDYQVDKKFGLKFAMLKFLLDVTKYNLFNYFVNCEIPKHFIGDDGEDIRLQRTEELTVDTYNTLKL